MKPAALLLLTLFPLSAWSASQLPSPDAMRLFTIERTENANELVYETKLTPSGGFPLKKPIHVYWIMKTKAGAIEELTALEKQKAYGVVIEKASESEVVFTLKAFKQRKIKVKRMGLPGNYKAAAYTQINDEEKELDRLYIVHTGSGLLPKVTKIDIFSKPAANGEVEKEALVP